LAEPIISATIALNNASTTESVTDLDAYPDASFVFENDIRFLVARKTTKGFIIQLNKPAPQDLTFDWIALAVKNAKNFESIANPNAQYQQSPTTNPAPPPAPSPEPPPSPSPDPAPSP